MISKTLERQWMPKRDLQGRFDAVPIVDTSVARLKQLMED